MITRRLLVGLVGVVSWGLNTALVWAAVPVPEPLGVAGEALGQDFLIVQFLDEDAEALIAVQATPAFDPEARALREDRLLAAYTEASALFASDDPAVVAQAQARLAWVLARAGYADYGAAYGNEALEQPATLGEVYLSRAWVQWRRGRWEEAKADAALAAQAEPPPPAWALAEWQAFVQVHEAAAAAYEAVREVLSEAQRDSPEFADAVAKAIAAGADSHAYYGLFMARNSLWQDKAYGLLEDLTAYRRVLRLERDLLWQSLGASAKKPEPAAVSTWRFLLDVSEAVTEADPERVDWQQLLGALALAQQAVPELDLTHYDLPGIVDRAEAAKAGTSWRARFATALADPRMRYASALHQALHRLWDDPADDTIAFLTAPEDYAPEERALLEAAVNRLAEEEAALAALRVAIPEGAAPVAPEADYLARVARYRLMHALLQGNIAEARQQLAAYYLLDKEDIGDTYRDWIDLAERDERRADFRAKVATLDIERVGLIDEHVLEGLVLEAAELDEDLAAQYGESKGDPEVLTPADLATAVAMREVLIVVGLVHDDVLLACDALAELEQLVPEADRASHPVYTACLAAVRTMPFGEVVDEEMLKDEFLHEYVDDLLGGALMDEEVLEGGEAMADSEPETAGQWMAKAAMHWVEGDLVQGEAIKADMRQRLAHCPSALEAFDEVEATYSPLAELRSIQQVFDESSEAGQIIIGWQLLESTSQVLDKMKQHYGDALIQDPKSLDAATRQLAADVSFQQVRAAAQVRMTGLACVTTGYLHRLGENSAHIAEADALVAMIPFSNDFDETTLPAWKSLGTLTDVDREKVLAAMRVLADHANLSISSNLGAVLGFVTLGQWTGAHEQIAIFREQFGQNRAAEKQVAIVERFLKEGQKRLDADSARGQALNAEKNRQARPAAEIDGELAKLEADFIAYRRALGPRIMAELAPLMELEE